MKTAAKAILEALKVAGEYLSLKESNTAKLVGKVIVYVAVGLTLMTQIVPSCDIKPMPEVRQEAQHE